MNQLRQLMPEELQLRNFAATTIRTYLHGVAHFSRYFRRSPDQLEPEDIRKYQATRFTKLKYSPNTVIVRLSSLRFLYTHVLKRNWSIAETPYPKKVRHLPGILSQGIGGASYRRSTPDDLPQHTCIGSGIWKLSRGSKTAALNISFKVVASDPLVHRKLAVSGLGMAILPLYMAKRPGTREQLVPVLPRWTPEPIIVCALFSGPARVTPKVRALLDFLGEYMGTDRDPRTSWNAHDRFQVLKQWLDAFNSGNSSRISAFWHTFGGNAGDDRTSRDLRMREMTGGMTIFKIEEDTGTHLVVLMKEGRGSYSESTLDLASTNPPVVAHIMGHPVPPPKGTQSTASSDEELAKRVQERVVETRGADAFSGAVLIAHHGKVVFDQAGAAHQGSMANCTSFLMKATCLWL